uniref:Candidate secreted effector n=1 Tax=Meloidogyne incognita TaxID=6306 RepID=A0A914M8M1_MELIC
MAQPSPPTDDELHLKGLQEGTEDNDNFIEESDWTRRIAGAGDGNRKVPATGANRIIDEAKLNQLLPRLNSQGPTTPSTTISTTTVSTTSTTPKNDSRAIEEATTINSKNETIILPTPELNNKNELINSTILIPKSEEFRKKKTKKNKRKRPTTINIPIIKQAEGVNSEGE